MTKKIPFRKVSDLSKVEQVFQTIRDHILDQNLAPGTELPPENEMAQEMNVSMFVMRQSLRLAQAQGLVEIGRGRRIRVASFSLAPVAEVMAIALRRSGQDALMQLVQARLGLECQVAELACRNALPEHLQALAEAIQAMEAKVNDLEFCIQKDLEFHRILVRASGNMVFEVMLAPLAELSRESRREIMYRVGVAHALEGHKKLFDAVQRHDEQAAVKAMQDHLRIAEEDLKTTKKNEV
jgi:GntR family transcriptional regulator, transcriptional repressor for pyruvate dehydrogenase complex